MYSKEDSEECVNDTYLKAWNSIPPNRPKLLKAFLGKITRNLSIDLYRKNRTKGRSGEVEIAIEELEGVIPSSEDIFKTLDEKYLVEKINEFLESINRQDRKIFLLRYFYLHSSKDIEKLTDIKVSTINTILYRTRNKLRKHLEKEGINPDGEIVAYEIHQPGIGRAAKELLRKVKASQFVYENGDKVCPANWDDGGDTLTPGIDLVGKI